MRTMAFEISPDTKALADRLAAVPHGGFVSYDELNAVIGRDVTKCRHLLYSAFKILLNEEGATFGVMVGEGYKRIMADQVPAVGMTARKRVRNTAKRAMRTINAGLAKSNGISNEALLRANSELSILGLLNEAAKDKNVSPKEDMKNGPQPVAVVTKDFLARIGG